MLKILRNPLLFSLIILMKFNLSYAAICTQMQFNPMSGKMDFCEPASASGSGTVNSGVAGRSAYYPSTGTTVDDTSVQTYNSNSTTITGSATVTGSFRVGSSAIVPLYLVNIYDTTGAETDDTPSLFMRSDNNQFNVFRQEAYGDDIISPIYRMGHARGTLSAPTATQSGDSLARWSAEGYDGAAFCEEALLRFDMPGAFTFFTSPSGCGDANLVQKMILDSFGNLAIGTDNAPSAKLDVMGTMFIDGQTNQVQATIQGNATQTADILVVENSAGVDILSADTTGVDIDGTFTVSGTAAIQNRKSLRFYEAVANGTNYDEFIPAASLSGNFVLTIPSETGTICTTGSVCSGYQASGSYLTSADIDTSSELKNIVGDETGSASGTPLLVFNQGPTINASTMTGTHNFSTGSLMIPNSTTPPAGDCDSAGDKGRIYGDTDNISSGQLFFCEGTSGWKRVGPSNGYIELNPGAASLSGTMVITADATQGAQLDGSNGFVLLFDATTDEGACWRFMLPDNWQSIGTLILIYSMQSATSLEVEWEAFSMCQTPGDSQRDDADSFTGPNTTVDTVPGTVLFPDTVTITMPDDTCAAGDLMNLCISTDSDDAVNDDATGDRRLLMAIYKYGI